MRSDIDKEIWYDDIIKMPDQHFYDYMIRCGLIKIMDYLGKEQLVET